MEELLKRHIEINEAYEKSKIEFDEWKMKIILNTTISDDVKNFLIKTERGKIQMKMIDDLKILKNDLRKLRDELVNP